MLYTFVVPSIDEPNILQLYDMIFEVKGSNFYIRILRSWKDFEIKMWAFLNIYLIIEKT